MTLTILSLEDEAEVRQALERDLEEFDGRVRVELAEDASRKSSRMGMSLHWCSPIIVYRESLVSISLLSSLRIQGLVRLARFWSLGRQIKATPSRH